MICCYRIRADVAFKQLEQEAAERDYRESLKLTAALVRRNPHVYRYRLPMAEVQYNLCNLLFFRDKDDQAVQLLANSRSTLLEAIRIDPNNQNAADELVRFTSSVTEALAERHDYKLAGELVDSAIGELDALRRESPEYASLQTQIESLQELSARLRRQSETEKPEGVV